MLRVKRLEVGARLPVVAHPGEDLGYDLFALEGTVLAPRATIRVRNGIAVEARNPATGAPLGLLVRDRSSMASRGIATTGGVILVRRAWRTNPAIMAAPTTIGSHTLSGDPCPAWAR